MKGNIHILSLYDVILLIPNPPVLSRLTLHNFKSSILLYWYTTNAHDRGAKYKLSIYKPYKNVANEYFVCMI